jgi:hypothetical protein
MPSRKPGRKSHLMPRSPVVRRLPKLAGVDFTTDAVLEPLGWNVVSSPSELRRELNEDIRLIVADYMSDRDAERRNRVTPAELRTTIANLERVIHKLINAFPDRASALGLVVTEAINRELDGLNIEASSDLDYVRDGLGGLHEAVKLVRIAERGAGPHPNRPALTLLRGLGCIYFERTGKSPPRSSNSKFGRFVKAINILIPKSFQLGNDLDSLVTAAVDTLKLPPNRPLI